MKKWLVGWLVLVFVAGCGQSQLPDEMHLAKGPAEFSGWVVIRKGLQPHQRMPGHFSKGDLDGDEWAFVGNLTWSSEGSRVPVVVDGVDTGYEVELAQVVYGEKIPVLKLAVYQKGVELALAYTWAAPDSQRIGINLRWMQAGLTRVSPP